MSHSDLDREKMHKGLVRRLYDEFVDRGNVKAAEEIISPDFVNDANELTGIEAVKALVLPVREAFPDLRHTIDDLVAEGDRVAVRWTMEATHRAPFAGVPATGKRVTLRAIVIYRFRDGRVTELWAQVDRLGLMQQLGAVPQVTPAGGGRPAPR